MPNPVFIGTGRFRGQWDASANDLYQTDGASSVETGTALTNGGWAGTMGTYVYSNSNAAPRVGDFLKVKTAGTTTIDGHSDWRVGDWVVYTTGSAWKKIATADAIASVVVGDASTTDLSNALLTGSHSRWEQQVLFVSGNSPTASFTGSNNFTYQYATNASTGYSALRLTGNLLVDGQIQAKQIHSRYVTSSVLYESGSTRFGDSTYDLHEFSGTLRVNSTVSGTSEWTGSLQFDGDISGASGHKVTFPYVSASTGVTTSQIGPVGDANVISLAAGVATVNTVLSSSTVASNMLQGTTDNHSNISFGTAQAKVGTGADPCLLTGSTFSASVGFYAPQIGTVDGDDDLLGLSNSLLSVNGAISASVGLYTTQIGLSGDDDLLGLASNLVTVNGAVSASTGVYTPQIGLSGDDDLLGLTSGLVTVNGAVSASGLYTTQIGTNGDDDLITLSSNSMVVQGGIGCALVSASTGLYTPQIGVSGDDDLLGLEAGELDLSGNLYVYPGTKTQAELTVVSGTVTMSGSTVGGTSGNGHTHDWHGSMDWLLDSGQSFTIAGGGSNTFSVQCTTFDLGAANSTAIGVSIRDNFSDALSIGSAGKTEMLKFDTTNSSERVKFGAIAVLDGYNLTGSSGTQIQVPIVSASAGVYTSQIGLSGDDDLMALSSGKLVVSGKVGIGGIADPDSYVDEKDNLVVGATAGNTGMTLVSANTGIATIQFRGNTTVNDKEGWIDYSQNTEQMRFGTAGLNTRMTINSAGGVGIGASTITGSAILELSSSTRGLVLSRLTETQRDAVSDPATGLIIYNSSDNELNIFSGSWGAVTGGGGGGSIDGSGASTRLAFWSDSDTLTSDANLTWTGSDVLTLSGALALNSNTDTIHPMTGTIELKTTDANPATVATGFTVGGETGNSKSSLTCNQDNNGMLFVTDTNTRTTLYASQTTMPAPHSDYNIDRARKIILSGSTFMGSSGQTQSNVDTHDVWGHFYCTSGSIRILSGATGRQDDFYGINLPNHSDKLGSIRANAFPTYSSKRWKYNVATIDDPLTRINQMRGVFFDWRETGRSDMGFIAEEVGEVLPRIVRYEDDGVHAESLDYGKIIPLCVEAIKSLSKQNEDLKQQLLAIKKDIESGKLNG